MMFKRCPRCGRLMRVDETIEEKIVRTPDFKRFKGSLKRCSNPRCCYVEVQWEFQYWDF